MPLLLINQKGLFMIVEVEGAPNIITLLSDLR